VLPHHGTATPQKENTWPPMSPSRSAQLTHTVGWWQAGLLQQGRAAGSRQQAASTAGGPAASTRPAVPASQPASQPRTDVDGAVGWAELLLLPFLENEHHLFIYFLGVHIQLWGPDGTESTEHGAGSLTRVVDLSLVLSSHIEMGSHDFHVRCFVDVGVAVPRSSSIRWSVMSHRAGSKRMKSLMPSVQLIMELAHQSLNFPASS
jgi:hypothetical protein